MEDDRLRHRLLTGGLLLAALLPLAAQAGVRFCAVGDVLLDREPGKIIQQSGPEAPLRAVKELLAGHDLSFCNLECPAAKGGSPLPKKYSFGAEPAALEALRSAGFNLLSMANNHSIDRGREALLETKANVIEYGMIPLGAGRDQKEARKPVIVKKNGLTFAFIANEDMLLEGIANVEDRPAAAAASVEEMVEAIKAARKSADFVVVSEHWGVEFQGEPTWNQADKAHRLIDAGADLVLGHHPHVLGPIESYRGRYIVYSLGNFLFDQRRKDRSQSMVFEVEFDTSGMREPGLWPVYVQDYQPRPATAEEGRDILERLRRLSRHYGVRLSTEGSAGRIRIEPDEAPVLTGPDLRAYPSHVDLLGESGQVLDSLRLPKDQELRLAVVLENSGTSRLYGWAAGQDTPEGQLVVIPFSAGRFGRPAMDRHRYKAWKLMLADVDGDGRAELCVGVRKKTRYHPKEDNRLFVFSLSGNAIYPKWLGSGFANPFLDFDFIDKELLLLEQLPEGRRRAAAYVWDEFGFRSARVIKEPCPDLADCHPDSL